MILAPPPRFRLPDVTITPWSDQMIGLGKMSNTAPTSQAFSRPVFVPIYLLEPFPVAKAFWCNGATVGTDTIDIGVYCMTDLATGRLDLIRSTGAILSAGANVVQASSVWRVARANVTSGNDSTDSATYTTASVTLKAGRLYLLSLVNTAASAAAPSGIAGGGTWTQRSTTQFNTTAHRVSIWSCVPTVDYIGTLVVTFGGTQTGACWVLDEMSGVDTSSNDGIVQNAVGTGNSTTPLATLAAFGSVNNATYGATGVANTNTVAPGSGFTELAEATAATPASRVETEWRVDNDTTVDSTVTSGQWGMCAVEIKADASPLIIPASPPGGPNIYMGFSVSGGTATVFNSTPAQVQWRASGCLGQTAAIPLPSTLIPGDPTTMNSSYPLAGFSLRTLLD